MNFQKKTLLAAVGIVAASGAVCASAEDDPYYSNSFRLGSYSVFYHSKADDLTGPYVPAGVNFKAKDVETLYVGLVHNITPHIEVELALGYPPISKVEGKGPATLGSVPYNGEIVSSARWLSPTLLLEYEFLGVNAVLRPYIGAGVNYTAFYDRFSTAQGNAASGGPTKLSLTSSVGPAGTVGLDWHISRHFHAYASYSISQVKTRIEADTGGVERNTHISFGPQALIVSGGFSF